jgi:hypothetical protein
LILFYWFAWLGLFFLTLGFDSLGGTLCCCWVKENRKKGKRRKEERRGAERRELSSTRNRGGSILNVV